MATGRDRDQAHKAAVAALGKSLSRRARSACELCGHAADVRVVEIAPFDDEPDEDAAILACGRCRGFIEDKRPPRETGALRFLEEVAWSEVPPVQIAAVQLLRRIAATDVAWASECLDGLWIDDAVQARLDA